MDELSRLGNSKMTYVQYCIMVGNSSLLAELLMNSDSKNLFLLGRDAVSTSFVFVLYLSFNLNVNKHERHSSFRDSKLTLDYFFFK